MQSSRSTAVSTSVIPAGPRTLSAQFPGTSTNYDYFIPPGSEPKVGDIILTSTMWGFVPGAGKLKDNILHAASSVAVAPKGRFAKSKPSAGAFLDDDGPDSEEEEEITVTLMDSPLDAVGSNTAMSIAAAIAFTEKLKPAVVTGLHQGTSPRANRFFIMHIPIEELNSRKQGIDQVVARTQEQIKARMRLAEIVREQAEMDLYRKVAAYNPEAQRLIAILEGKDPNKT